MDGICIPFLFSGLKLINLKKLIVCRAISQTSIPIIQGFISRQYDNHSQGELLGVLSGLNTLAGFIGPLIFNNLFAYFISDSAPVKVPGIVYFVASGVFLVSLLITVVTFKTFPSTEDEHQVSTSKIQFEEQLDEEQKDLLEGEVMEGESKLVFQEDD